MPITHMLTSAGMEKTGTVLIVDDNPNNLSVLFEYLEESALEVSVARSGEQALQQLKRFQPDIILLDVMMPGMDGFEICRRLKAQNTTRDIPIIFMTALTDSVNKMKGFLAGGADYITKPLQHEEVLARVSAHLKIRQLEQHLQEHQDLIDTQKQRINEQQQIIDDYTFLKNNKDLCERLLVCISYDLQQPFHKLMRSIRLLVENIDDYGKNEFKGHIRRIETDAEELYASHENLLIWVAHRRGLLEYAPEPIDLHELAAYNIARFMPQAEKKKITLSSAVQEDTMVYADYNMVDIIFRNILSNAIKFTANEGRVRIATNIAVNMIEVSITDTGVGIHPERMAYLFHSKPYVHNDEKVGLGLLLCRKLSEKHNGRIWCTSEPGKGTTVTFTLPRTEDTNHTS